MKKFITCIAVLIGTISFGVSQPASDPLFETWNDKSKNDSIRLDAIEQLTRKVIGAYPDSAMSLAKQEYAYAVQSKQPYYQCAAKLSLARIYAETGSPVKAVPEAKEALRIAKDINDPRLMGLSHNALGIIYKMMDQDAKSMDHFVATGKIALQQKDTAAMTRSYGSIGIAFSEINDEKKAEEYFLKALALAETTNNKRQLPFVYQSLGNSYKVNGDGHKAIEYFTKVLNDTTLQYGRSMKASLHQSIAQAYRDALNDPEAALPYYRKSLEIRKEIKNRNAYGPLYVGIGLSHIDLGKYDKAILYCDSALSLCRENKNFESELNACKCLYNAYKAKSNSDSALHYYELASIIEDELFTIDREKEVNRKELGYAYSTQALADSLEFVRKESVMKMQSEKQQLGLFGALMGLFLVLALAFAIYNGKKKSDELLLNILPAETAKELKEKGHSDAKLIDQVTVLFTDFKGFTAMSEKVTPKDLVKDLHECFSAFDGICEKYGIEKIKTIGDAYMAAGGLQSPNTSNAQDVVKAAFEMRDFVEEGKQRKIEQGLPFFEIRIGIHTGPVVAGIVGIKKFQYDIWGDTVNTASRMESSGEVGKVNISETTYRLVKDEFSCSHRGKIQAKGKGEMEMYFVQEG